MNANREFITSEQPTQRDTKGRSKNESAVMRDQQEKKGSTSKRCKESFKKVDKFG